jgi:enterochelin esterase-like enzyme
MRSPCFRLHVLLLILAALALSAAPTSAQWITPAVTAPRVQYRTFFSPTIGRGVSYHIYTPPAYDAEPTRRFPVLYWLHGSGSVLPGIAPVSNWFNNAIAQGKIAPMLVVFPNGMPYDMWCDSKSGVTPIESVVVHDLIPTIDATFRTLAGRKGRIVEGFSMGGYGAGRLGFKFHDRFAAISMLAGGPLQLDLLDAPDGANNITPEQRLIIYQNVYGSDPDYFLAQSPWMLATQNASNLIARATPIRQIIGTADFTFPDNLNFHNHLLQLGVPHQFIAPPGIGHDTLALFNALGEDNWTFYRGVFRLCPADLTGDQSVDDADFIGFAAAYNRLECADPGMPANCPADLNADEFVDDADFVLFAAAYDALVCP